MAFDGQTYMKNKTALMTAAAALALWDNATDETDKLAAGEHLAALLRAKGAPKAKAPAKSKTPQLLADLRAALKVMVKQVGARATIPILNNVLLWAKGDKLILSGTDLDSLTTIEIDAPGIGEWKTTVNARDLAGALKANGDVLMEAAAHERLTVVVGGASSSLTGLPAGDFPVMGLTKGKRVNFSLPTATVADMLGFVGHCISTEETRYYLNGVYLCAAASAPPARSEEHEAALASLYDLETAQRKHERAERGIDGVMDEPSVATARLKQIEDLKKAWAPVEAERMKPDVLRVVTTDGHRLATADAPLPHEGFDMAGIIIPRLSVALIQMILGYGDKAEITVVPEAGGLGGLRVTVGNATVTTKLIDGAFPDYTRVIPKNNAKVISVVRRDTFDAVKSVAAISKEKSRSIRLDVADRLRLSSRNMEGGLAEGSVSYEREEIFEPLSIGFNASYLMEGLAAHDGEVVQLAFEDPASPALLMDSSRPDRKVVLMPLRL